MAIYCHYCGTRVTDAWRTRQSPVYCDERCEYLDALPPAPIEFSPGAFIRVGPLDDLDD